MRTLIFILLLVLCNPVYCPAQEKTVKLVIDSSTVYFRFFYRSPHHSDYYPNDSVRLVGRKITEDKFYLDKYIYRKRVWTKTCSIVPAKDSLHVRVRTSDAKGRHKLVHEVQPYYNGILSDQ